MLFHESDGALLCRIERISESALTINSVGEIVPYVGVDLIHGRTPLEADIHMRERRLEHLVGVLIAKVRLGTIQSG